MVANRVAMVAMMALVMLVPPRLALAQVPPHRPGTICFTPKFWCWANPVGPAGSTCYCPSPYGRVQGQLR
jgi:hypothetical protein